MVRPVRDLNVKTFADGAHLEGMLQMAANPLVRGFTTNPTPMRKAGLPQYEEFACEVLERIPELRDDALAAGYSIESSR